MTIRAVIAEPMPRGGWRGRYVHSATPVETARWLHAGGDDEPSAFAQAGDAVQLRDALLPGAMFGYSTVGGLLGDPDYGPVPLDPFDDVIDLDTDEWWDSNDIEAAFTIRWVFVIRDDGLQVLASRDTGHKSVLLGESSETTEYRFTHVVTVPWETTFPWDTIVQPSPPTPADIALSEVDEDHDWMTAAELERLSEILERSTGLLGPLPDDIKRRLYGVFEVSTEDTWDDVKGVILKSEPMVTLWEAVVRVDPAFQTEHAHGASWDRVPDRATLFGAFETVLGQHPAA